MYTIDDIRGQFNIEGSIKVVEYHDDNPINEEYVTLYKQENGTAYNIPEELCYREITYMYANDDGYLWIELNCKNDD